MSAVPFPCSGDIAVMEADARLCYHAVPRILPAPPVLSSPEGGSLLEYESLPAEERRFCVDYLASHRINLNIRQVN